MTLECSFFKINPFSLLCYVNSLCFIYICCFSFSSYSELGYTNNKVTSALESNSPTVSSWFMSASDGCRGDTDVRLYRMMRLGILPDCSPSHRLIDAIYCAVISLRFNGSLLPTLQNQNNVLSGTAASARFPNDIIMSTSSQYLM